MNMQQHPARPDVGTDRWADLATVRQLMAAETAVSIADRRVARLHGLADLADILLTAGERSKSFATLQRLCARLHRARLAGARRVVIIGGGSVGDVAGLAAHLVKRGMPVTMVPSTMLAAVDSSLGGKTAVNGPHGAKNAFGAYHFHDETLLCPDLWQTLDSGQWLDGRSEAIKMALCCDARVLESWQQKIPETAEMVTEARAMKSAVCRRDPFEEKGERFVLNFGHTLGHALEALHNYRFSHGYCVALGMHAALDIGHSLGVTSGETRDRARAALNTWHLPESDALTHALQGLTNEQVIERLRADKKGKFQFVLLSGAGQAELQPYPEAELRQLLVRWREGEHA